MSEDPQKKSSDAGLSLRDKFEVWAKNKFEFAKGEARLAWKSAVDLHEQTLGKSKTYKTATNFAKGAWWLGRAYSWPARKISWPAAKSIYTYTSENIFKDEKGQPSKYGAALGIVLSASLVGGGTGLAYHKAINPLLVEGAPTVAYYGVDYVFDGASRLMFAHDEKLLLSRPQYLADQGIYEVSGCEWPCSANAEKTPYYVVEDSVVTVNSFFTAVATKPLGFVGLGELVIRSASEVADEAQADLNVCSSKVLGTRNDMVGRHERIIEMTCEPYAGYVETQQQPAGPAPDMN